MDTAEQELKAGYDLWQRALTELAARAEGAVPAGNPFVEWADFSATDRHWTEVATFMDAIVGSLGDDNSAGANVLAGLGRALVHRFRAALWWLVTAGSDEPISESVKLRAAREIPSFTTKGGFRWLAGNGARKAVMAAIASKGDAVVGPLFVVWLKAAWAGAHKGAWSNSEQSGPPALQLFKPLYGILSHPQFFTGEGISSTRFDITAESLVAAENVGYPGAVLDAIAVFRMGVNWAMESARSAAAPRSADEVAAFRILTAGFTSSAALSQESLQEMLDAADFLTSSSERRHGVPPDWSELIDCAYHFKTRVDSLWSDWRRIDKNSHDTGYVRAITGPLDDAVSSRKLDGRGHPWEWANAFQNLLNRVEQKIASEFDFDEALNEMRQVRYRELKVGSKWLCHLNPGTIGGSDDYVPGTIYVYLGCDSSDDLCLISEEDYELRALYSPNGVTMGFADVTPAVFREAFIAATSAATSWWQRNADESSTRSSQRSRSRSDLSSKTPPIPVTERATRPNSENTKGTIPSAPNSPRTEGAPPSAQSAAGAPEIRAKENAVPEFDFEKARGKMHSVRYREMEVGSEWLCHKRPRTIGGSGDYAPGTVYVYLGYDSSDDLCLISKEDYESRLLYSPHGVTRGGADLTPAAFQEAFIEATSAARTWWARKSSASSDSRPAQSRSDAAAGLPSTRPPIDDRSSYRSSEEGAASLPSRLSSGGTGSAAQSLPTAANKDSKWPWILVALALLCVPVLINVLNQANSRPALTAPAPAPALPTSATNRVEPTDTRTVEPDELARVDSLFFRDSSRQWNFRTAVCRRSGQGRIMPADNGANYRMEWNPSNPAPLRITRQRENRDAREDRAPQVIAATPGAALVRAALCDQWPCAEPDIIIYLFLQRDGGAQVNGFFVTAKGPMRPLWGSVSDSDTSCDALNDLSPHLTCSLRRLLDLPFSRIQRGMEHDAETGRFATEAFAQCGQ